MNKFIYVVVYSRCRKRCATCGGGWKRGAEILRCLFRESLDSTFVANRVQFNFKDKVFVLDRFELLWLKLKKIKIK